MKPLFIPLKKEYFGQFNAGKKTEEYRPYGPRWNEKTCPKGRDVVLSLGYSRHRRLYGMVTGFRVEENSAKIPGWVECYGKNDTRPVACIEIYLP